MTSSVAGIVQQSYASLVCDPTPETLYLITGSFSALFLYILAFNTTTHELSLVSRHDAFGPHQWITTNAQLNRLYATSWAWPPNLYSWKIIPGPDGVPGLSFINEAPISATSSYITVRGNHTYSIGGPSGEVHALRDDGGYGDRIQEILYVPPEEFANADKTRKALREGSHGIEFTQDGLAFVPHLGTNSIWIYQLNAKTGTLELLGESQSVREHDGPRHALPHPNGKYLYVVTEHTSFLDVYEINDKGLVHRQAASLIPSDRSPSDFRGDTLRLSRRSDSCADDSAPTDSNPPFLFATTRGTNASHKGYLAALALDSEGLIKSALPPAADIPIAPSSQQQIPLHHPTNSSYSLTYGEDVQATSLYETPTSGGKANAISLAPYHASSSAASGGREGVEWLVLTDDEQGYVFMIEWDAERGTFKEISRVKLGKDDEGMAVMASHAIWLA